MTKEIKEWLEEWSNNPNQTNIKEKAIIFCSANRKERKNIVDTLINYCSNKNLEIIKIYSCSQRDTNKNIDDMYTFVREQTGRVHIVTKFLSFKLEYLFKDFVTCGKIVIHSYKQSLIIDKSNSCLMTLFTSNLLNMYLNKIKKTQTYYVERGYCMGLVPIGYKNVRNDSGCPDIVVDTIKAPIITKLFKEYSTGSYSIKTLTELAHTLGLQNRNGKPVSETCINDMLKNKFYIGMMRWNKKFYPHNYPTIIDKSLFDKVQNIMMKHTH